MSGQTTNSPVQFSDYLGNIINRGDIIAFTYDKYGCMYTGIAVNARKTPKSYTMNIVHGVNLVETTLSEGRSKFSRVCVLSYATPNLDKVYLDKAFELRNDGKDFILPDKVITKHTFEDFETRWMRALSKSVVELIRKIGEKRAAVKAANTSGYWGRTLHSKYSTVFSEKKFNTYVSVELNHRDLRVDNVVVNVTDGSNRWNSIVLFDMVGNNTTYAFKDTVRFQFDGRTLVAGDVESKMKEILNA